MCFSSQLNNVLRHQNEKVSFFIFIWELWKYISILFLLLTYSDQTQHSPGDTKSESPELWFAVLSYSKRKCYKKSNYKSSARPHIYFGQENNGKDVHIRIPRVVFMLPYMAKEILQMWLRTLRRCSLDYPGGLNIITSVLIRRKQEGQDQRRCENGTRGHKHVVWEPRNAGGLWKLSKTRKQILS